MDSFRNHHFYQSTTHPLITLSVSQEMLSSDTGFIVKPPIEFNENEILNGVYVEKVLKQVFFLHLSHSQGVFVKPVETTKNSVTFEVTHRFNEVELNILIQWIESQPHGITVTGDNTKLPMEDKHIHLQALCDSFGCCDLSVWNTETSIDNH